MDHRILPVIVGVLLLTAGCNEVVDLSDDSDRAPSDMYMDFHYESGDKYVINGTVDIELITDDDARFEDVTLCLYGSGGELLNSTIVGDFAMPGDQHDVRISSEQRPMYIILDHPGFRSHDMGAEFTVWTEDRLWREADLPEEEIQEFDYTPPTEPGTCGGTS